MPGVAEKITMAKPCKHCGGTDRYKSGGCKPCVKRKAAEWQKKNRERTNAKNRRWSKENPRTGRKQRVRTYEERKAANPEGLAALTARHAATRRARLREATVVENCPRIAALYEQAAAMRAAGDDVHVDHIIPLAAGGPHIFENLRIIPADENRKKGCRVI